MGCWPSNRRSGFEGVSSEEERRSMGKVLELLNRSAGQVSISELEFIKQTFISLQQVDESRRKHWMNTIENDIIAPLYYSSHAQYVYSSSVPFESNSLRQSELAQKDFPVFSHSKEALFDYLLEIYSDFIVAYDFDIVKFQRFLYAVKENYQNNPFHNFYHGFAVTQMLHVISTRTDKFAAFIPEDERLALLLSSLGHDLNHPGVTNMFMVNSRHSLAVRYNDISVLENHHAATLIHFLELEGCDFLTSLGTPKVNELRRKIIPTILATDMAKHASVMDSFRTIANQYDRENTQHRQAFVDILLHATDVGNPTLKFDLATVWSLRIIQEFNQQVWEEEQRALPVTEMLRVGTEIDKIKQNQIGFINFVILPLWELVSSGVPNIEDFVESIRNNKESWNVIEKL